VEAGAIVGYTIGGAPGDKDAFAAADESCRRHLAGVVSNGPPAGLSPDQQDRALRFAQCMRDHGIDMPDPVFGGQASGDENPSGDPQFDSNDDGFGAAQDACLRLIDPEKAGASPGGSEVVPSPGPSR